MNLGPIDKIPMATVISLASIIIVIIGYISNDLTVEQALVAIGASLGGAGALGFARNGSGRGMRG